LAAQPDGIWNFYCAAVDAAGNRSVFSPSLSVTIDTTPPPAPGPPDLEEHSDTGISSDDNITLDDTPTFVTTGVGSNYWRLCRNNIVVSKAGEWGADGLPYVGPGDGSEALGVQPEGTGDFSCVTADAAGNQATGSVL